MTYRVQKLALTAKENDSMGTVLTRIPARRGRIPKSALGQFHILARKLYRNTGALNPSLFDRYVDALREVTSKRRHTDALKRLLRSEAVGVLVPLLNDASAPRMDEVLRLISGLELARRLRNRGIGKVVTVLAPVIPTEGADARDDLSAIFQRNAELEDVNFYGGGLARYLSRLDDVLPGTGFSAHLADEIRRCAHDDPSVFKAKLFLRWFDDEHLTWLTANPSSSFGGSVKRLFDHLPLVAIVRSSRPNVAIAAKGPLPWPSVSATMVEGKVEKWLEKFGLTVEDVLSGDIDSHDVLKQRLPESVPATFSAAKERVLSGVLNYEMGLGELGIAPRQEIKKALDGFDIACDRLRDRASNQNDRERETLNGQLGKLFGYLLPTGGPQQASASLFHYMDFYGPDFLRELRDSLELDDVRHQAVFLADDDEDSRYV